MIRAGPPAVRVSTPVRFLASFLVAAALLLALSLWGGVTLADFVAALRRLDARVWTVSLALHGTIYALRAWRFQLLVPRAERPSYGAALAISSAHNLASYVLPAKTGEATLVLYLKGYAGVSASAGLASLVVSRLFDLAVLCGGVSTALFVLSHGSQRFERLERLGPWFAPIIAGLAIAIGAVCLRPHVLSATTAWAMTRFRLHTSNVGRKVLERLTRVNDALRATSGLGVQAGCLVLTIAQWAFVFAFYAVLARGAGLPSEIGYPEAVFGSSLAILFNLLPVNGFAGFGTQEAGWKIGFLQLGVEPDLALATGVAVHLVQLANVVLFGLVAHAALGWVRQTREARARP
jgi:uncharacterized protein (TIRG00374 family)